jgi:hypothetical protein
MANAVLFIGWNRPHVGHEKEAYGFLTSEGLAYLEKQKGKFFDRIEMVALTAHGGDLNGCILLFGERAKLDELRRTDEFEGFSMQMGMKFDRYGVVPGLTIDGIREVMKRNEKRNI